MSNSEIKLDLSKIVPMDIFRGITYELTLYALPHPSTKLLFYLRG